MKISYNPLWKTLEQKSMTKSELRIASGLQKATLAKLSKDESVTLETILRICEALKCDIEDVVSIV